VVLGKRMARKRIRGPTTKKTAPPAPTPVNSAAPAVPRPGGGASGPSFLAPAPQSFYQPAPPLPRPLPRQGPSIAVSAPTPPTRTHSASPATPFAPTVVMASPSPSSTPYAPTVVMGSPSPSGGTPALTPMQVDAVRTSTFPPPDHGHLADVAEQLQAQAVLLGDPSPAPRPRQTARRGGRGTRGS
jgi:hypothetical protein